MHTVGTVAQLRIALLRFWSERNMRQPCFTHTHTHTQHATPGKLHGGFLCYGGFKHFTGYLFILKNFISKELQEKCLLELILNRESPSWFCIKLIILSAKSVILRNQCKHLQIVIFLIRVLTSKQLSLSIVWVAPSM